MRYTIDRMTLADIPRVTEIEKLAYPSPWPSSTYRKELQENTNAHYIVVRDSHLKSVPAAAEPADHTRKHFTVPFIHGRAATQQPVDLAAIIGFAGLWRVLDESHITTIAVHPGHRGNGAGELLLNTLVELSFELEVRHVTLEVRVSNTVAQNLYRKYGFIQTGIRRRYYSDNHEDAAIMTTSDITSPDYREQFLLLRSALIRRLADDESMAAHEPDAGSSGDE